MYVVWLAIQQRMADNGWMFTGRENAMERTDEWVWKTNFLVRELGRGSKSGIHPGCPCARCKLHLRKGKKDMSKHLWSYGYWEEYTTTIDFGQYELENSRVMRQRINGIEDDGMRNFLEDLRNADIPDSPPSREEPLEPSEPEEPEPTPD